MIFEKRQYQKECVGALQEYFSKPKKQKPSLVIAPVAAGKSLLIAWSIEHSEDKVLVLQPSVELLKQNYKKMISLGVDAKIYSASMKSKEIGHITYATIGSIINKLDEFIEAGVKKIIVDEVHLYSWKKENVAKDKKSGMLRQVVDKLGATHTVGLTASPCLLRPCGSFGDSYSELKFITRCIPKLFTEVLYNIPISEMVENGFWKKLEYKSFNFKNKFLELNSNKSDYSDKSMRDWYIGNKIQEDIIKCINACLKNGKKSILVFLPSVQACLDLEKLVPNSKAVYGDMPKEDREIAVEGFLDGTFSVVFNMEVLTTGFDFLGLDCLILARPTNSLAKYYQMIGRITRLYDVIGTIIDLVGLVEKFGRIEDLNVDNIEGYGWGMFSKNILLTGVPMDGRMGIITKESLYKPIIKKEKLPKGIKKEPVFKFGNHAYKPLKDIPKSYLQWALKDVDFTTSVEKKKLKEVILKYI